IVMRIMRERAAAEPMDGTVAVAPPADGAATTIAEPVDADFSLAAALRTPSFWAMLLAVSISPMVLTAVIFHQVALFESHTWAVALIPAAFAAYALASVGTTYASGIIF